jgi:probable F420-dependent oxidoreductase
MMAQIRFGLGVTTAARPDTDPVGEARLAEEVGFDFVSASDHLHGTSPTFEPWTLLTTIAASTSRVQVATRVLGLPYRPPAVVAKMAESLDRLSGGRLILGLGGGYLDDEFRALGLRVPSPRDKIDGLDEAIQITRGLWTERTFSFDGRQYRTEGAELEPKPTHRIPIWLGMYKPRGLALTGRLADGWIPSYGFAPPEVVVGLADQVRRSAEAAGRDPGEITFAYNVPVRVDAGVASELSMVSGSAAAVSDRLIELADLGFNAFNLIPSGDGTSDQIELLGREVIPAVRASRPV